MFGILEWLGALGDCDGHVWDCLCPMCSSEAFPGSFPGTVGDPAGSDRSWPLPAGVIQTKGKRMVNPLLITTLLALEKLDSTTLASAYNGFTAWGDIGKRSNAYQPMLDASLIHADGTPCDMETFKLALHHEVKRRVDACIFN